MAAVLTVAEMSMVSMMNRRPGEAEFAHWAVSYDSPMTSDPQVDGVLTAALGHVRGTGRIVVVGTGGIGKSTLVTRLVEELAPDDVIAVAADVVGDGARVVSSVLDAIGEPALAGDSVEAVLGAALVGRRVAIVIDGADSIVDDVLLWSTQVPADGAGPWVVVASRVHPLQVVSPVVHLGPLSLAGGSAPSYAETLFRVWYAEAGGRVDQLDATPVAVQRLLATTGGVPLAIRVAAATSAAVGLAASEAIIVEGAGRDAVAASINRSVSLLASSEREVFDAFAVSAGTIDVELAAAIVGRDRNATAIVLGTLARHNLVDLDGGGYTMLPPVHRFASANAGRPDAARIRHRSWCLALDQRPDHEAAILRREPDVRFAIDQALVDDATSAADLTASLAKSLLGAEQHHRVAELLASVLAHPNVTAMELTDRRIELMRLLAIALHENQGGIPALAVLDEADQLITRSSRPDYWGARLLSLRAGLLHDAGQVEDAFAMAEHAAQVAAACGDTWNELQTRHLTVNMLLDLGRLSDADELAAAVIAACTDDTSWLEHMARATRALVALERGDRALCAATGRRLLAEADALGKAVDAEYLLTLADPVTYAPQIRASLAVDPTHPAEWVNHLQAQTCVATAALVAGDYQRAVTVASDIVVIAEALPMCWMLLSGLLLMGDAALLCGDRPQALAAYRQALVRANQQSFVLRAADAVEGLTRLIASGDDRRIALATAAQLRRIVGAARLPRPWLPSLDTPRGRTAAEHPPSEWMIGGRLTEAGLAAIIASAADSLTAGASTTDDPIAQLSPAERRVAELVADGLTNREIGAKLHIARRTVETHIVHSFQKLNVQNRTQLARLVAR
jgi:DNA-binding CsgD family transcriptional regulator